MRVKLAIIVTVAGLNLMSQKAGVSQAPERQGSAATNAFPLASYRFRGHSYSYSVPISNLEQGPLWDKQNPEPPLSLGRALSVARSEAFNLVRDTQDFKIVEVALKRLFGDYYYYIVK